MEILWEKVSNFIKENVSPQNYETWISPVRIVSMEGNQVCLSVPNKFFKDWLRENYLPTIEDAMVKATGVTQAIDFVIDHGDGAAAADQAKAHPKKHADPGTAMSRAHRIKAHPSLNPFYSFERFVVGTCNQFAHAASVAVAEQPAKNYNPLFIYSDVGLGKTHLLNAIGLHSLTTSQDMNVLYVSAEEFMNELINAIRYDKMPKFRDKYRKIDCLLIDDIQFIAGKERTQEEFFHTFNTLHDSGKQIVITSDKFPKDIPNLEDRLRSRFEWGLIADIHPPEIETKIAILEKKAQEMNLDIPHNVSHFLASHAESNIRELEGFLVRISAFVSVTGRQVDLDLVREVLKKIFKQKEKEEVTIDEIVKVVSAKLNLKVSEIRSQKKNKQIAQARQLAMFLARKLTSSSFPDIGEKIGGRDHSTVIYACNKLKKQLEDDPKLKKAVQEIEEALLNRS